MKLFSALQWMQDCSVLSFMEDTQFYDWLQENRVTPVVNFRQFEVLRVPALRAVARDQEEGVRKQCTQTSRFVGMGCAYYRAY